MSIIVRTVCPDGSSLVWGGNSKSAPGDLVLHDLSCNHPGAVVNRLDDLLEVARSLLNWE